jgi:hypothetical protein
VIDGQGQHLAASLSGKVQGQKQGRQTVAAAGKGHGEGRLTITVEMLSQQPLSLCLQEIGGVLSA